MPIPHIWKYWSGELKTNAAKVDAPVDQNQPFMLLFKLLEDGLKCATAVGAPYIQDQLVNKAKQLILAMGKYNQAYKNWVELPDPQKTYTNMKT
eukprot:3622251-Ditylum_brightwellii.AAC.1